MKYLTINLNDDNKAVITLCMKTSNHFKSAKGVRGRILLPALFNIYVSNLSSCNISLVKMVVQMLVDEMAKISILITLCAKIRSINERTARQRYNRKWKTWFDGQRKQLEEIDQGGSLSQIILLSECEE